VQEYLYVFAIPFFTPFLSFTIPLDTRKNLQKAIGKDLSETFD
jgi:hypothetical protein